MSEMKQLDPVFLRHMKRGAEFLGCQYPIICGAMTWVSDPSLVATVLNAGCFACIAGGNAPTEILERQIDETRALSDKNFAVNLITIAPNYKAHLELLKTKKVPYIVFAGSIPKDSEIMEAKATGAKVLCFASTISIALKMIKSGADALILEGCEAGGHIGHVTTMILLQQLLFRFSDKLPIFVAGGIATGRMMAHVLAMGAAGVQLGTRFAMTEECNTHPDFKKALLRAHARDAIATPQIDADLPVVAVRALRNEGTKRFVELQLKLLDDLKHDRIERKVAAEEVEKFWIGALRRAAMEGDVDGGSVMSGQIVGLIDDILPVRTVIDNLLDEANATFADLRAKFKGE